MYAVFKSRRDGAGLPEDGRSVVAAEVDDLLAELAGKGVRDPRRVQRQWLPARRRLPDLVDRAELQRICKTPTCGSCAPGSDVPATLCGQ